MSGGVKGYPNERQLDESASAELLKFATVVARGYNRRGLDVNASGLYVVANDAAETGSTASTITATSHVAKPGDIIRFITTSNGIYEKEIEVKSVTANVITLVAGVSAAISNGDTFAICRGISATYDSGGGLLASQAFLLDGVLTTVSKDTVNPANNVPFPVEIVGTSGTVTINASNLNLEVQISHAGATYDSTRIGDGTTLLAIEAVTGKAQVKDEGAIALLTTMDADTGAIATSVASIDTKTPSLGQSTMANSVPVVIASNQSAINVTDISGTVSLPTGAATSALQTTLNGLVATEATLAVISGKLGSLGQKTSAGSAPVVLSTEQEAILSSIDTKATGIASLLTEATFNAEDFSTETTLAAMSAKLPASLGVKAESASISVIDGGLHVKAFGQHAFGTTAVTDAAYVQLNADIGAVAGRKFTCFMSSGEPLYLAVGAGGSEANIAIIPPGGLDKFPLEVNIPANARLSLKAVNAATTVNSGVLIYHVMG